MAEALNSGNVARHLSAAAEKAPDRPALIYPRGRDRAGRTVYEAMTFRGLDEESNRYAGGLRSIGVGRGCRVLLMVPPAMEFVALAFAIFKTGAVLILIDPGMGKSNLLGCIREAEPEALVAVPQLHALRLFCRSHFRQVRCAVTAGRRWFWGGPALQEIRDRGAARFSFEPVAGGDPAAVFFTTGSTGPPKGVLYLHAMLDAQIQLIRGHFRISESDVGLPAFAPFALFCVAMGTTCVIPDMDPARPAAVDVGKIVPAIQERRVTYSFGSPAFWERVSRGCIERGIRLNSVNKIILAGAPVSGALLGRLEELFPAGAESYTPYGATEALPVTSISGSEVLADTLPLTNQGAGVCVGRALPGVDLKIIAISDEAIPNWDERLALPPGEIGEIVVRGRVVTREYYNREGLTAFAKIRDGDAVWHRMGDVGYLDERARLWFCGRKSHRVVAAGKSMFTISCEAIFNRHPEVFRSALVGVGQKPDQRPVIVIEPREGRMPAGRAGRERFIRELLEIGSGSELTRSIEDFLFHPSLPVDFRHNAKIIREKLAVWAARRLRAPAPSGKRGGLGR